jgi:dienelactone hydrolase
MTRLPVKDELLSVQTLRAAGSAPYGGADIGECLAAASRVKGGDLDSWHDSWSGMARTVLALAEAELAAGHGESARLAFWRASTYFRTAGVMLMGTPVDPRLVACQRSQADAFRRGAALMSRPPQIISIPYDDASLPGYLFLAGDDDTPRPAVILNGGYDGTAEELYFATGAAALARGYHVLAFDGPGQGAALLEQGMVLRPDWENVITPVFDYLAAQPGVDSRRIALIGWSLGGYLAPRAASGEHRLAACIADCGSFDLHAAAIERIPGPLAAGLSGYRHESGHPAASAGRARAPAHPGMGAPPGSARARSRRPARVPGRAGRLLAQGTGRPD